MDIAFIDAVASVLTTIGVIIGLTGLYISWRHRTIEFEDDLNREYRNLAIHIPSKAFFGETLSDDEYEDAFPYLLRYIDLSNEQVFLRQQGKISKGIWGYWCEGIQSSLERSAYRRAWEEIKERAPDRFAELRHLDASGFRMDPKGRNWSTSV